MKKLLLLTLLSTISFGTYAMESGAQAPVSELDAADTVRLGLITTAVKKKDLANLERFLSQYASGAAQALISAAKKCPFKDADWMMHFACLALRHSHVVEADAYKLIRLGAGVLDEISIREVSPEQKKLTVQTYFLLANRARDLGIQLPKDYLAHAGNLINEAYSSLDEFAQDSIKARNFIPIISQLSQIEQPTDKQKFYLAVGYAAQALFSNNFDEALNHLSPYNNQLFNIPDLDAVSSVAREFSITARLRIFVSLDIPQKKARLDDLFNPMASYIYSKKVSTLSDEEIQFVAVLYTVMRQIWIAEQDMAKKSALKTHLVKQCRLLSEQTKQPVFQLVGLISLAYLESNGNIESSAVYKKAQQLGISIIVNRIMKKRFDLAADIYRMLFDFSEFEEERGNATPFARMIGKLDVGLACIGNVSDWQQFLVDPDAVELHMLFKLLSAFARTEDLPTKKRILSFMRMVIDRVKKSTIYRNGVLNKIKVDGIEAAWYKNAADFLASTKKQKQQYLRKAKSLIADAKRYAPSIFLSEPDARVWYNDFLLYYEGEVARLSGDSAGMVRCYEERMKYATGNQLIKLKYDFAQVLFSNFPDRRQEVYDTLKEVLSVPTSPQVIAHASRILGLVCVERGEYDQAEQYLVDADSPAFRMALSLDKQYQVRLQLAKVCYLRNKFPNARRYYNLIAMTTNDDARPYRIEAYADLAKISFSEKKYNEALQYADKSLALNSDYAPALAVKGAAYLEKGNNEDAYNILKRGYNNSGGMPAVKRVHLAKLYGTACFRLNKFEEARSSFNSIKKDIDAEAFYTASYFLFCMAFEESVWNAVLTYGKRCLDYEAVTDQVRAFVQAAMAIAHAELGNGNEAVEMHNAIELTHLEVKEKIKLFMCIANLCTQINDLSTAERLYREVILIPGAPERVIDEAIAHLAIIKPWDQMFADAKAMGYARAVLNSQSPSARAMAHVVMGLALRDKPSKEMSDHWHSAFELLDHLPDQWQPIVRAQEAHKLVAEGMYEAAEKLLKKCIDVEQTRVQARALYGYLLYQRNKLADAYAMLKPCLDKEEDTFAFRDLRALGYLIRCKQGQRELKLMKALQDLCVQDNDLLFALMDDIRIAFKNAVQGEFDRVFGLVSSNNKQAQAAINEFNDLPGATDQMKQDIKQAQAEAVRTRQLEVAKTEYARVKDLIQSGDPRAKRAVATFCKMPGVTDKIVAKVKAAQAQAEYQAVCKAVKSGSEILRVDEFVADQEMPVAQRAHVLLKQAKRAIKKRNEKEAVKLFKQVSVIDLSSVYTLQAYWYRALIYLRNDNYEEARTLINPIQARQDLFAPKWLKRLAYLECRCAIKFGKLDQLAGFMPQLRDKAQYKRAQQYWLFVQACIAHQAHQYDKVIKLLEGKLPKLNAFETAYRSFMLGCAYRAQGNEATSFEYMQAVVKDKELLNEVDVSIAHKAIEHGHMKRVKPTRFEDPNMRHIRTDVKPSPDDIQGYFSMPVHPGPETEGTIAHAGQMARRFEQIGQLEEAKKWYRIAYDVCDHSDAQDKNGPELVKGLCRVSMQLKDASELRALVNYYLDYGAKKLPELSRVILTELQSFNVADLEMDQKIDFAMVIAFAHYYCNEIDAAQKLLLSLFDRSQVDHSKVHHFSRSMELLEVYYMLADIYAQKGDRENALQYMMQLTGSRRNDQDAGRLYQKRIAQVWEKMDDLQQALHWYEEFHKMCSDRSFTGVVQLRAETEQKIRELKARLGITVGEIVQTARDGDTDGAWRKWVEYLPFITAVRAKEAQVKK